MRKHCEVASGGGDCGSVRTGKLSGVLSGFFCRFGRVVLAACLLRFLLRAPVAIPVRFCWNYGCGEKRHPSRPSHRRVPQRCCTFLPELYRFPNGVLCLSAFDGGPAVYVADFTSGSIKLIGSYPFTTVSNDMWAYSAADHVYYFRLGSCT